MRLGDEDDLPQGVDSEVREPQFSDDERPVDLAALRADDALVEELAAGRVAREGTPEPGSEDELVAMLAAWVAEVRPDVAMPLATPSAATGEEQPEPGSASVTPLGVPRHRTAARHRAVPQHPTATLYARRLAAAAALVVLGTSGLAVSAASAEPGEVLWPVSRVFYADRARSVEAAVDVHASLERARTALREGRPAEAAQAIRTAAARLPEVRPAEGHEELVRTQQQLVKVMGGPDAAESGTTGSPTSGSGTPPLLGTREEGSRGRLTPSAYAAPPTQPSDGRTPEESSRGSAAGTSGSRESSRARGDESTTGGSPSSGETRGRTHDGPSSGSERPGRESSTGQTPGGTSQQPGSSGPQGPTGGDRPSGDEPGRQQDSGGDRQPAPEGGSGPSEGRGATENSPSRGSGGLSGNDSPSQNAPAPGSDPQAGAPSGSPSESSGSPSGSSQQPSGSSSDRSPGQAEGPSRSSSQEPAASSSRSSPSTSRTENTGGNAAGGSDTGASGSRGSKSSDSGSGAKKSSGSSGDNGAGSTKSGGRSGDHGSGSEKSGNSSGGDKSGGDKSGGDKSGGDKSHSLLSSVTKLVGKVTGQGD